jgi:hypothetical protein
VKDALYCTADTDRIIDTAEWTGEEVERCAARLYEFPAACRIWSFGVLFDRPPEWFAFVDPNQGVAEHLIYWAGDPDPKYLTTAGRYIVNIVARAKQQLRDHLEQIKANKKGKRNG